MSEETAPVEQAGSNTRTLLLVGLGVIAAAALIVFVLLPLLTGDDVPEGTVDADGDVVVADASEDPTEVPTEDFDLSDPGEGGEAPAETFEVFAARDPFQQLVRESTDGGGGTVPGDGTTPGGGTTTPPGSPTTPTTPTTPVPTASPSPGTVPGTGTGNGTDDGSDDGTDTGTGGDTGSGSGTSGDDDSATVGGTTVTLVDVFTGNDGERKATVTVNGTGYTVEEGSTFGRNFRLLDISGDCATMLFGDSRFTLCEGERIQK